MYKLTLHVKRLLNFIKEQTRETFAHLVFHSYDGTKGLFGRTI